jgi:ArsR family transcriptional regulator
MTVDTELFFRALAHPLRMRALLLLFEEGELCVCELSYTLNVSQPMISRHLAGLRQAGLVSDRRQGQWIYYRLSADLPEWARNVLTATGQGLGKASPYADDRAMLAAMPQRPGSACCN